MLVRFPPTARELRESRLLDMPVARLRMMRARAVLDYCRDGCGDPWCPKRPTRRQVWARWDRWLTDAERNALGGHCPE